VDCEKFDRIVLDLLYAELDELTSAAAKRHMDHCVRCHDIDAGLRATREVGVLPALDPPEGLEQRILEAERKAHAGLPLGKRLGRAITIVSGYAMRPQLAMAALLVLMIGASLLFLRARPGSSGSVHVTERGIPESEAETFSMAPAAEPESDEGSLAHGAMDDDRTAARAKRRAEDEPAPAASPGEQPSDSAGSATFAEAMHAYDSGRYAEAERMFDRIAEAGGDEAASAALNAARAARASGGCPKAAARFDQVHSRFSGSTVGNEAAWQAASCYRSLGQLERARKNYQALLSAAGYEDRARAALGSLDEAPAQVASRKAAAKMAEPPAAAAPPKASPAPPQAKPAPTAIESDNAYGF
jgi:hypothetical protein